MPYPCIPSDDLDDVLVQQHGILTVATAVAHFGRSMMRRRIAQGRWQRPRPGVVVTHSGPLDQTQRLWVAVLAAGNGTVLAGLTAATCDGLRGFGPGVIHVLLPHRRKVTPQPAIVVHRSTALGAADVHPARLPPRTRLPRSLIDAASWAATDDGARAVLAAGVQQRLVRPADLRAVVDRFPTLPRRELIRLTLDDIAGGAEALSEIDFARLVRRYGLPEPDRQVVRRDGRGLRRWLDVYFDKWGVVVEIDGFWHMEATQWWADMDRDNQLTIDGDRVLRYPSFVLRERERAVAEQLRLALRNAGWPG